MQTRLIAIAVLACSQPGLSGCASIAAVAAAHPAAVAAATDMIPVAAVMGGIGLVGIAGIANHRSDEIAPGTLGALLKDRQAAVAETATAAMREQRDAVLAAALEADRAVVRARVAFRDELSRKPEGFSANAKAALAGIDASLATLARGTPEGVRSAAEVARATADKLDVPVQVPQVRSLGPHYVFSSLPFQTLTVRGSFPSRYPGGALPRLTINGRAFEPHAYDAQTLNFTLPTDALGSSESQVPVWTRAGLTIPWDPPRFEGFARDGFESFVVLGLLPHAPGRATLERRQSIVRSEEATRTSDAFSLGAEAGELEQAACLTLTPKEMAEGWKLKAGTGSLLLPPGSAGAIQDLGRQSGDARSVCWRVRMSTPGPSDAQAPTLWRLSAVIQREVREWKTELETFDLAWGSSRVFNVPAGDWKLRYAKYGGPEVEFTGTDRSNPLFRVDADARSVKVSTFPF